MKCRRAHIFGRQDRERPPRTILCVQYNPVVTALQFGKIIKGYNFKILYKTPLFRKIFEWRAKKKVFIF